MTAWMIMNMSQEERGALALGGIIFFLLLCGVCKLIDYHKGENK